MSNVLDELIQEMSDVGLFVPEANITIQNVVGEGEAASLFEQYCSGASQFELQGTIKIFSLSEISLY